VTWEVGPKKREKRAVEREQRERGISLETSARVSAFFSLFFSRLVFCRLRAHKKKKKKSRKEKKNWKHYKKKKTCHKTARVIREEEEESERREKKNPREGRQFVLERAATRI